MKQQSQIEDNDQMKQSTFATSTMEKGYVIGSNEIEKMATNL